MVEIRARELTHEFDDREVLRSLSFTCSASSLAITGPNGSGKSTLARILAGLLTPTEGDMQILVEGELIGRDSLRNVAGLAAPDVRLYAELTVRENLAFLSQARARTIPEQRMLEALERVGLAERADDVLAQLSSGLRQRASLAAAVLHRPQLLILDEPSTNLDERGMEVVRELIEEQKRCGMVVVATNDASEAALCSERLDLGAMR